MGIIQSHINPRVLCAAEGLLWVVGILLIAIFGSAKVDGHMAEQKAKDAFAVARERMADLNVDTTTWSDQRLADYRDAVAGYDLIPLGILRIPSIELEVPLFQGADEVNLNRGVGRILGTGPVGGDGNLGVAGHRDGFFRGLRNVELQDRIEIELLDKTNTYEITEFRIVEPSDTSVLTQADDSILTLVTCYPFYFVGDAPQRYIVRAVRIATPRLDGQT